MAGSCVTGFDAGGVGDPAGWDVVQFDFQTGSGPGTDLGTVTFDVTIFDNAGSLPASTTACACSNLPRHPDQFRYRLVHTISEFRHLAPGIYWLSEVANPAWDDGLFIWSAGRKVSRWASASRKRLHRQPKTASR